MRFNLWAIEPNAADEIDLETLRQSLRSGEDEDEGGEPPAPYAVRDGIALLSLQGLMLKRPSWYGEGTALLGLRLRAAAMDPDVSGILLVVDSPGGTADGTAALADAVRAANGRKPVHAFIDGMACSAAYYAASQAGSIWAGRSDLIGSIGTFAVMADYSKMAEKAGIKVHVVRSAPLKGAGIPGDAVTEDQLASEQRLVDRLTDHFVAAVAQGRGVTEETARGWATGEVFTGDQALKMGLVDRLGSVEDAWASLLAAVAAGGARGTAAFGSGRRTGAAQGPGEGEEPMRLFGLNFGLSEALKAGSHTEEAHTEEAHTEEAADVAEAQTEGAAGDQEEAADPGMEAGAEAGTDPEAEGTDPEAEAGTDPEADDGLASRLEAANEALQAANAERERLSATLAEVTNEAREAAKKAAVRALRTQDASQLAALNAVIDASDLAGARALADTYNRIADTAYGITPEQGAQRVTKVTRLPDVEAHAEAADAPAPKLDPKAYYEARNNRNKRPAGA